MPSTRGRAQSNPLASPGGAGAQGTPYFVDTYHEDEELQKICTFPRVCQKQRQDLYERTGQVAICTSVAAGLKWLMRRGGAKPFVVAITAPYWDLGKKHEMWSFGFGGELRKFPPEVIQQFQLLGWVTRRAMDRDVFGEFLKLDSSKSREYNTLKALGFDADTTGYEFFAPGHPISNVTGHSGVIFKFRNRFRVLQSFTASFSLQEWLVSTSTSGADSEE